jgi:hypothetical protein
MIGKIGMCRTLRSVKLIGLVTIILAGFLSAGSAVGAAEIHGTKWNDLNGNGVRDGGEPGLPGWDIRVSGPVGGDHSTLTDANGDYGLLDLAADTYSVFEVPQAGWTQTFPAAPGIHVLLLDQGQIVNDIDFGNWQPPPGAIHGTKWNDLNGNGVRNGGEPGLPGWTIRLDNGVSVVFATTGVDGEYHAFSLTPGTYTVSELQQSGWTQVAQHVLGPRVLAGRLDAVLSTGTRITQFVGGLGRDLQRHRLR